MVSDCYALISIVDCYALISIVEVAKPLRRALEPYAKFHELNTDFYYDKNAIQCNM